MINRKAVTECCKTCLFYQQNMCTCCWSNHYSECRSETDKCETWHPGYETENKNCEDK